MTITDRMREAAMAWSRQPEPKLHGDAIWVKSRGDLDKIRKMVEAGFAAGMSCERDRIVSYLDHQGQSEPTTVTHAIAQRLHEAATAIDMEAHWEEGVCEKKRA